MTAHGVIFGHGEGLDGTSEIASDDDIPARESTSEERRWSAIRKTTVCDLTYGGDVGAAPFLPVPVQIST